MLWNASQYCPAGLGFTLNFHQHRAQLIVSRLATVCSFISSIYSAIQGAPVRMDLYIITILPLAKAMRRRKPGSSSHSMRTIWSLWEWLSVVTESSVSWCKKYCYLGILLIYRRSGISIRQYLRRRRRRGKNFRPRDLRCNTLKTRGTWYWVDPFSLIVHISDTGKPNSTVWIRQVS